MKKRMLCLILSALLLSGCSVREVDILEKTDPTEPITTQTVPTQTETQVPENPYGPMDFGYEGDYLTCLAGESMLGVDVSYWQGDSIDWEQVAAAGVEFVIIRLAWRGSQQGLISPDDYVQLNYEGARAAGLKVGGYFFSQAISPQEAVEEAEYCLELVKDWQIEMPLVFDWEYIDDTSRTAHMDADTLTACSKAFCDTIQEAGYQAMIYFNPDQAWRKLNLEELTGYEFWLAHYDTAMTYQHRIHMWQYTDSGSVPGIPGNVDLNLYLSYEDE